MHSRKIIEHTARAISGIREKLNISSIAPTKGNVEYKRLIELQTIERKLDWFMEQNKQTDSETPQEPTQEQVDAIKANHLTEVMEVISNTDGIGAATVLKIEVALGISS